ncbi:hypothetical protein FACS1894202_01340 [Clostridia bacterium]|nr:hypothetical protein FACS1894202_01340 [Clostridia bacterium]
MITTTTGNGAAMTVCNMEREPLKLEKRIGSTTFVVSVRFCNEAKETLEDKILKLIEREVYQNA